jgi:uncharacterized protein (DUF2249 family)
MNDSTPDDIVLDVRGLQPPEPMERVLDALDLLAPGRRLRMLIDREPVPLYRILERNGYCYQASWRDPGTLEVEISQIA